MAYELKDGQGSLFLNDRKGNDKAPIMRGNLLVGGVKYKLSVWGRTGHTGIKFWSIKAEPDQPRQVQQQPAPAQRDLRAEAAARPSENPIGDETHFASDDIPF